MNRRPARYTANLVIIAVLVVACLLYGITSPRSQSLPHGILDYACIECHAPGEWETLNPDRSFTHADTGFPLTGAHIGAACRDCHPDLIFADASPRCSTCHRDVHNGEFGLDCARCHDTASFSITADTGFHETSRFPLRGAHRGVPCIDCHTDGARGRWRGLDTACISCHAADYAATTRPDHRALGISTDCSACHTEFSGFRDSFDHLTKGFPLTGAHKLLSCNDCHSPGGFAGPHRTCNDCHSADYARTTTPNHLATGFSRDCEQCHTTAAWVPSSYDHSAKGFPLTGAHLSVSCIACHPGNQYAGAPTTCIGCHDDVSRSADPSHTLLQFSTSCETCHTTSAWTPAIFTHTATYRLTGAHASTSCSECHTPSRGKKPPTACYACHAADYNGAANHRTSQFSQDCTTCHTTTAWRPSSFVHASFPIYSGTHRNRWSTCTQCHANPADYASFTCFSCHSPTIHRGHTYTSADCYRCHPDGREDD